MKNTATETDFVTIHAYPFRPAADSVHVFVSGYALHPSLNTYSIALNIAKSLGQKEIPVTVYGEGRPTVERMEV